MKKISRLGRLGSKPWALFAKPRLGACKAVYHPYALLLDINRDIIKQIKTVPESVIKTCVQLCLRSLLWYHLEISIDFIGTTICNFLKLT